MNLRRRTITQRILILRRRRTMTQRILILRRRRTKKRRSQGAASGSFSTRTSRPAAKCPCSRQPATLLRQKVPSTEGPDSAKETSGKWSESQEAVLIAAVKKVGGTKWRKLVADPEFDFEGRSWLALRNKWKALSKRKEREAIFLLFPGRVCRSTC